jgi:predicted ATPase
LQQVIVAPLRKRGAVAADDRFRQALDWERRQSALSSELGASTSLARLLGGQGRSADATALLQPVYDRFTEGFDTADLKDSRRPRTNPLPWPANASAEYVASGRG